MDPSGKSIVDVMSKSSTMIGAVALYNEKFAQNLKPEDYKKFADDLWKLPDKDLRELKKSPSAFSLLIELDNYFLENSPKTAQKVYKTCIKILAPESAKTISKAAKKFGVESNYPRLEKALYLLNKMMSYFVNIKSLDSHSRKQALVLQYLSLLEESERTPVAIQKALKLASLSNGSGILAQISSTKDPATKKLLLTRLSNLLALEIPPELSAEVINIIALLPNLGAPKQNNPPDTSTSIVLQYLKLFTEDERTPKIIMNALMLISLPGISDAFAQIANIQDLSKRKLVLEKLNSFLLPQTPLKLAVNLVKAITALPLSVITKENLNDFCDEITKIKDDSLRADIVEVFALMPEKYRVSMDLQRIKDALDVRSLNPNDVTKASASSIRNHMMEAIRKLSSYSLTYQNIETICSAFKGMENEHLLSGITSIIREMNQKDTLFFLTQLSKIKTLPLSERRTIIENLVRIPSDQLLKSTIENEISKHVPLVAPNELRSSQQGIQSNHPPTTTTQLRNSSNPEILENKITNVLHGLKIDEKHPARTSIKAILEEVSNESDKRMILDILSKIPVDSTSNMGFTDNRFLIINSLYLLIQENKPIDIALIFKIVSLIPPVFGKISGQTVFVLCNLFAKTDAVTLKEIATIVEQIPTEKRTTEVITRIGEIVGSSPFQFMSTLQAYLKELDVTIDKQAIAVSSKLARTINEDRGKSGQQPVSILNVVLSISPEDRFEALRAIYAQFEKITPKNLYKLFQIIELLDPDKRTLAEIKGVLSVVITNDDVQIAHYTDTLEIIKLLTPANRTKTAMDEIIKFIRINGDNLEKMNKFKSAILYLSPHNRTKKAIAEISQSIQNP